MTTRGIFRIALITVLLLAIAGFILQLLNNNKQANTLTHQKDVFGPFSVPFQVEITMK